LKLSHHVAGRFVHTLQSVAPFEKTQSIDDLRSRPGYLDQDSQGMFFAACIRLGYCFDRRLLKMTDGIIEVVSEGNWKLFTP
jgi:hypothetical protein